MSGTERTLKPHLYRFGRFTLDTEDTTEKRLLFDGRKWKIQDKQFLLLCVLVQNHGEYVSADDLIKALWPNTYVQQPQGLHTQIKLLRRRLGEATEEARNYIKARAGGGAYSFQVPVEVDPPLKLSEESYADLTFYEWIRSSRSGRRITASLGAGIAVSISYLIFYWTSDALPAPKEWLEPKLVISLIQAAVIAGAFIATFKIFGRRDFRDTDPTEEAAVMKACGYTDPKKWNEAKIMARGALSKYTKYWKWLFFSWGFLYLMFAAVAHLASIGKKEELYYALVIAATFFNNCSTLALGFCFVVLNRPSIGEKQDRDKSRRARRRLSALINRRLLVLTSIGLLLVSFTLIEAFLIFKNPLAWQSLFQPDDVVDGANWISGILGGIIMALYVGRVQSKFLDPAAWLPFLLYSYTAIQPLYAHFGKPVYGILIIEAALILKCLLYDYVAWLFKSGRLLFYFVRVKPINEGVNVDWKLFLSILDKVE